MAEGSNKFRIEIPKALVNQALAKKPAWLPLSDEEFLCRMVAKGNYDAFFAQLTQAEESLEQLKQETQSKMKNIEQTLGVPVSLPGFGKRAKKPNNPVKPSTPEIKKI
jgi:hypothetical protein